MLLLMVCEQELEEQFRQIHHTWAITPMLFTDNSKLHILQILDIQSCQIMCAIKLHSLLTIKKCFLG